MLRYLLYKIYHFLIHIPVLRRLFAYLNKKRILTYQYREQQKFSLHKDDLRHFEEKYFSQNGEDGIIQEIFRRIGTTDKFFLEFGMEDGQECNGRWPLEQHSWRGLWMDGSDSNIESAKQRFKDYPVQLLSTFITAENIVSLIKSQQVPHSFDFLTVDIDGNDYWVLLNILNAYFRPRVICVEYNSYYFAHQEWVMPYNPKHIWQGSRYFGASLKSLTLMLNQFDYELVCCDRQGINAFFVLKECIHNNFCEVNNVEYHYCCPKFHTFYWGHPAF